MGQAVRARARYRLDEYATGIAEPDVSAERGLSSSHRPSSWRFPSPIVVRRPCTRARPTLGPLRACKRSSGSTRTPPRRPRRLTGRAEWTGGGWGTGVYVGLEQE